MANQTKKHNTASGGLYIALAICILSVICIGVYSAILNIFDTPVLESPIVEQKKENKNNVNSQQTPLPSVTTPKATAPMVETPQEDVKEPQEVPEQSANVETPEENPEQNVNALPTPTTYTMPVAGDVSVAFSHDILVYSETMNDYRVHNGVDLSAALGTPVKAFTDGVVLEVYEDPLMGQTVVLQHGNETKSIYQNLSDQLPEGITVGAAVKEGDVIGGVGETVLIECAQPPHLHFGVCVSEKYVDPMEYFQ